MEMSVEQRGGGDVHGPGRLPADLGRPSEPGGRRSRAYVVAQTHQIRLQPFPQSKHTHLHSGPVEVCVFGLCVTPT